MSSKWDVMQYFYTNGVNYGVKRTFVILSVGLLVGMVIYFTYFITSEKVVYSRKFNWSLVMVLLTTELIMLVISSNVVVSLGMVGALSIVRYRTAVKDSRDTAFLFWAITEGLCVSAQMYPMASTSVLFISMVMIMSSKVPGLSQKYMLMIYGNDNDFVVEKIEGVIVPKVKGFVTRSINKSDNGIEMIFEIKIKNNEHVAIIDEIKKIDGIREVRCVSVSGETVG